MANFFDTLFGLLSTNEKYISSGGELLRNAVLEDALKMDPGLIKPLYG